MAGLLGAVGFSRPVAAQSVHDAWRTLETEHYRLTYPLAAEAWVLGSAPQLDGMWERVAAEVDYEPDRRLNLVVIDPFNGANGFALPLLRRPIVALFPTAPSADSIIGNYRSWPEELLIHEQTHVDHLIRPSRNWVVRLVEGGLGLGPIATRTPNWAIEGYATMVEGRLTGWGRPHSDLRASFLRGLAQDGALPDYASLSGSDRWLGGAMPYLVGSAFMEWLEDRQGVGSFQRVWARLSARQVRGFDEAFQGVFGDPPQILYQRFRAQLTYQALEIERQRPVDTGTLWADLSRSTGPVALSADGSRLAVVLRFKDQPARLEVWDTAQNTQARDKWRDKVDALLDKDPDDVAPLAPPVWTHEVLAHRSDPSHSPRAVRWMPDGRLLFTSTFIEPDGDGVADLVIWDPDSGRERRLTRGAGVHDADPHPDGSWAVAVHQRWGLSGLVRVDLQTGEVTPITPDSATVMVDAPRLSPDGQRLAYLRNEGAWRVVIRELGDGSERVLPLADGVSPSQLAWGPSGQLYATLGYDGFVEVHTLSEQGEVRPITRSRGGAFAPEPTPDGRAVFYLVPDAQGLDVHRIELSDVQPAVTLEFTPDPPVVPVAPVVIPLPQPRPLAREPRAFRGRPDAGPLLGGFGSTAQDAVELGLRVGDVIQRTELIAMGSLGGVRGGSASLRWRGLPVELGVQGFALQEGDTPGRAGGELSAFTRREWSDGLSSLELGGWADTAIATDGAADRLAGFARPGVAHRLWRGQAWLGGGLSGDVQLGRGDDAWWRGGGTARLGLGWLKVGLRARYGAFFTDATAPADLYRVGGGDSSLLPDAWASNRLAMPALAPGVLQGDRVQRAALDLGTTELSLFASAWQGPLGASERLGLVGLRARVDMDAQPLVRLPSLSMSAGAACQVQSLDRSLGDVRCDQLQDYVGWASVRWRP